MLSTPSTTRSKTWYRNRFVNAFIYSTANRMVERLDVSFSVKPPTDMSGTMRVMLERMFNRGYGKGGYGLAQGLYEMYLMAAQPKYLLNVGAWGLSLSIMDEQLNVKVPGLIEHLNATTVLMVKDFDPTMKDYLLLRQHDHSYDAALAPAYHYGRSWCQALKPAAQAKIVLEHLGDDAANVRAMCLFQAGRRLQVDVKQAYSPRVQCVAKNNWNTWMTETDRNYTLIDMLEVHPC